MSPSHLIIYQNTYLSSKSTPKDETPTAISGQQYTGPLVLLNFVGNETASFIRQISCCHPRLEKELNRQRQTLKPLENQGFFRLSLLYRNATTLLLSCILSEFRISTLCSVEDGVLTVF